MIEGSCHCGAVRLTLPAPPAEGNACQCSVCRRYGVVWGYYRRGSIRIDGEGEGTVEYVRDAGVLRFVRCRTCGCVSHWQSLVDPDGRMGVNMRLFEPAVLAGLRIYEDPGPD